MVFADLAGSPDPGETAPDFTGPTLRRDYAGGTFVSSTLTLSDFAAAGEVVHFAVFGTWCPACLPALAAMRGDIDQHLPVGAELFVVDQGEQESTLRHVLSKTYIPIEVYLDADGSVGGTLYDQPAVGLPFGRGYVIDAGTSFEPVVTDVFTGYEPQAVLEAIGDDL
jgi:peroxiredoxin